MKQKFVIQKVFRLINFPRHIFEEFICNYDDAIKGNRSFVEYTQKADILSNSEHQILIEFEKILKESGVEDFETVIIDCSW